MGFTTYFQYVEMQGRYLAILIHSYAVAVEINALGRIYNKFILGLTSQKTNENQEAVGSQPSSTDRSL